MEKTIFICDRCGKQFDPNVLTDRAFYKNPNPGHSKVLLCEDCACEYDAMLERQLAERQYFMKEKMENAESCME